VPGPVCYGRGGNAPTVTDADLVLGYLDPSYFLGGRMSLDLAAAHDAIHMHIASKLNCSVAEAAWGIHQIANENMANAARVHALERGKDPRRFPLFAFGGAGPLHAYRIAKALGSPSVLAPLGAGIMSTVGFLSAPLAFDFVRSWSSRLANIDWAYANALFAEMQAEGNALLEASGVPSGDITHTREVDMRYVGQGHEIRVPLSGMSDPVTGALSEADESTLHERFKQVYMEHYERLGPPVPLEIINWRVVSSGPKPNVTLNIASSGTTDPAQAIKGKRMAYFPEAEGYVETTVYDRYKLAQSARLTGPAIIEERESTVIVGPDAQCHIDAQHNLVVDMR
jgi:N-methylhydantoinase A